MNCGGRPYYDTLTERCSSCGYYAEDTYRNGQTYVACRLVGYILHGPAVADCTDFRTPEQLAFLRSQQDARKRKK